MGVELYQIPNHIKHDIEMEREYQNQKWGENPHDVAGWLTIMRRELREAEDEWCGRLSNAGALAEILQIVAVGIACLEQHGSVSRWKLSVLEEAVEADKEN